MIPGCQSTSTAGDCESFLNTKYGSGSVVFPQGPLRKPHELFEANEVKQGVMKFPKITFETDTFSIAG